MYKRVKYFAYTYSLKHNLYLFEPDLYTN